MEKVIKYRCSECGELFATPEEALACEARHRRIKKANVMLRHGYILKQINDKCEIWDSVPKHLENVNKDNCFKISYWQCCQHLACRITRICFDGEVHVSSCGSWNGYYSDHLKLSSSDLMNPRPKEELFIDSRYTSRW